MKYGSATSIDYTRVSDGGNPLTVADAKSHLRVTNSDEDGYISTLVAVARTWVEEHTRRCLMSTTWDLDIDCGFPAADAPIVLPWAPLQSVTSISYYDADGSLTVLSSSLYEVDTSEVLGIVRPVYQTEWPSARFQSDAVTIRYVSGYGASADSVPPMLVHAMRLIVGHLYAFREPVVVGTTTAAIPMTVTDILAPFRVGGGL